MTTCLDVITRSLRLIGVVSPQETVSGADADTGLSVLNNLLESLGLFRAMSPGPTEEEFPLSANVTDYEIGAGKTFDTVLPAQIDESTFIRIGTIDYPIRLIDGGQWAKIPLKSIAGYIPSDLYFYRQADYGVLRFYPAPGSGCVLHLRSWKPFSGYASVTDEMVIQQGFSRLLPMILAEELAPEYGREAPPSVIQKAAGARHQIKAINLEVPSMETMPPGAGRFNIFAGRRQ